MKSEVHVYALRNYTIKPGGKKDDKGDRGAHKNAADERTRQAVRQSNDRRHGRTR
jgi:hypothetical protein